MIEITGDLFELYDSGEYDAIVIPTNGTLDRNRDLVMGAGVALAAMDRWPWLPSALALGRESFITPIRNPEHKRRFIIAMRTKNHWRNPSTYGLVRSSASAMEAWVNKDPWCDAIKKVILPRVGCGRGGLTWADVKRILKPHMDDRFHVTRGKK